jgi:hypothetical protein
MKASNKRSWKKRQRQRQNFKSMNLWGPNRNQIADMVLVQLHLVKLDQEKSCLTHQKQSEVCSTVCNWTDKNIGYHCRCPSWTTYRESKLFEHGISQPCSSDHTLWFIPPKLRNSPSSKPPSYHRIWRTFHSHMSPAPTVVANSHL